MSKIQEETAITPQSQTTAPEFLWPQLKALPAFRALIRAQEARLFHEIGPLPEPVLDIGAGDGHFTEVVWGRLNVGIELDAVAMAEALKRDVYDHLLQADATRLPFPAETFQTVVSNCVLEHIPGMPTVMKEVYRVLQPGGLFVFSVPTPAQNDFLFVTRMLRFLKLESLAQKYMAWFRKIQVHHHMHASEKWAQFAEEAGFHIERSYGYMSRIATTIFDLGHYAGVPNLISRKIFGKWVVWPWRPRFFLMERLLQPMVQDHDPATGTCRFFLARKPDKTKASLESGV